MVIYERREKKKLRTRDMKRKRERKKSNFDEVSKAPEMELQAKLAMLGAATNKKKAGRSITGKRLQSYWR